MSQVVQEIKQHGDPKEEPQTCEKGMGMGEIEQAGGRGAMGSLKQDSGGRDWPATPYTPNRRRKKHINAYERLDFNPLKSFQTCCVQKASH